MSGEPVGLTGEQVGFLLQPLHPSRVQSANGQSHLAAWDVRRHLLRVFGWGGWSFEVLSCDVVSERTVCQNPDAAPTAQRFRSWVVYRVLGRLTIRDADGVELARFEDGATGDAANQPSLGDAHDMALKTAMSQALKRCAVNLGDAFGLSLYNGGSPAAVVHRSLAHPAPVEKASEALPTEQVQAGDDDPHAARYNGPVVDQPVDDVPLDVPPGVDPATGEVTEPSTEAAAPTDPKVQRAADLAAKAWRVRKVESLKSEVYDVAAVEGLLRIEAPHPREDRRLPLAALITVRKAELLGAANTREDVPA